MSRLVGPRPRRAAALVSLLLTGGVALLSPSAAAADGPSTGMGVGPAGLVVQVLAVRRTEGHLLLTLNVANHSPGTTKQLTSELRSYLDQRPVIGASVLNPETGSLGDPLGTVANCECTALPIFLDPGQQVTTSMTLADPGGSVVDVVFADFQPALGVPVSGGAAISAATGSRKLAARSQTLLARTRKGAARIQSSKGAVRSLDLDTDVLFAFGSAKLSSKAHDSLETAAAALKAQPKRRLAIFGHTDGKGSSSTNQTLSQERAQAVRSALAPLLGAGWTFDVKGFGETKPVAPETTAQGTDYPDGRALNRRVELTLLG